MDVATQTGSGKLEDQAANAALYSTEKQSSSRYPLDRDNKLSSAGAAASLKYANPRDLPSYPSKGLTDGDSSAGAAASLANANQKSFEYWKPDASSSASKAAMLAKDYKPAPLWHPEMSSAGSKAALLAAKEGANVNVWRPEASADGNSAAGQAMRNKNLSPSLDYGYTADGSRRALLAATGAMSGRRRAGSSPTATSSYPDSANSVANALNAATIANKPSTRSNRSNLGPSDVPGTTSAITNLGREMYTSHPPVAPEVEEKNRQAGLRAAAISMAKQMYDVQQKLLEQEARGGTSDSQYAANSVHRRQSSISSTDESYQAPAQYANLQEAAKKLAAERLAKIHDHDENAAYRDYYGMNAPAQSRLSVRGRTRRRASSDGQTAETDEERSRKIRSEMSQFNDKLAQIDAKKRQRDRDALMAAAQRNVKASMHGMDEKVFAETGKASPAMMSEWEAKARARAEADSSARIVNHGKVNIGGGKYLDQSEIDAIAAARVQPTLDEITEKAEAHRARDEQLRREEEERKRAAAESARAERERNNRTKEEWKRFKEEEKRVEREKKEQEKARKVEERRLRDEKRRSKGTPSVPVVVPVEEKKEEGPTMSETPVLDPIPKMEPISTEDTAEAQTSVEPIPIKDTTEVEQSLKRASSVYSVPLSPTIQSPTSEDAEIIAARVVSAPVVDTSDDIKVPSVIATDPSTTEVVSTNPETETTTSVTEPRTPPKDKEPLTVHSGPTATTDDTTTAVPGEDPPTSPNKTETKGISSWLKSKFSLRGGTKSTKTTDTTDKLPQSSTTDKPFVGGAALTGETAGTTTSIPEEKGEDSDKEVALAGRQGSSASATAPLHDETSSKIAIDPSYQRSRSPSTSTISSLSKSPNSVNHKTNTNTNTNTDDNDLYTSSTPNIHTEPVQRGRATDIQIRREDTTSSAGEGEGGPQEEFEEARDHFDPGHLPLPAFKAGGRVSDSPVRDSRFSEDL